MESNRKAYEIFKMGRKFCFVNAWGVLVKQGTRMEAEANILFYRSQEVA